MKGDMTMYLSDGRRYTPLSASEYEDMREAFEELHEENKRLIEEVNQLTEELARLKGE